MEKVPPDLLSRVEPECIVLQHKMNPAEDRFVEIRNSVGSQEQNPFAVFQHAKEHLDKLVTTEILLSALFHVYICFVQEDQCLPVVGDLEDARQMTLHHRRIQTQFSRRDLKS